MFAARMGSGKRPGR